MRTQDEIVAHIKAHIKTASSLFGFNRGVWIAFLDFERAQPFLLPGISQEKWSKNQNPLTESVILQELRMYAEFGWQKIEDHRGLSAQRTVEKMCAWLWLLGTPKADELIEFAEQDSNYPMYGAPILARICEAYGFPIPDSEDVQRMRNGQPCHPGCDGCQ